MHLSPYTIASPNRLSAVPMAPLPERLVELLRLVTERTPDGEEFLLGEVAFRPATLGLDAVALEQELLGRRWPGMPPELLPFATDSCGNRFCLIRGIAARDPERCPVGWWMYETGLTIPIASSFERFLDWIGISSELNAQRRVHPLSTQEHHLKVVVPTLEILGLERDFAALTLSHASPVGSLALGMMRVDPQSPSARLVAAERALAQRRTADAHRHANAALDAFPEFLAARWFLSGLPEVAREPEAHQELLRSLMYSPLTYRGDQGMPDYDTLPAPTPTEIADRVASAMRACEGDEDPAIALAIWDDPLSPFSWLRAGVEVANMGTPTRAIALASNALFLSRSTADRADALRLLEELHDASGHAWHLSVVQQDLLRLRDAARGPRRP